jgi:F-box protein 28
MPRRESARRNHPLACESDIVETVHMRLTLLHMTFGKHIERRHCCFFPGEVTSTLVLELLKLLFCNQILDEVNRILLYIGANSKLTRPYKVTDELFDLSTMAMEYFKDKIEPTLPEISYFDPDFLEYTNSYHQSI